MKILHFILGKANPNRANGVNYVIHGLCKYSVLAGHEVSVVGVSKGLTTDSEIVERENFHVKVFKQFYGNCFKELKQLSNEVDIVHLHSVWQHYNIIFANYLISINKPYVITVHSGLTGDRIRQSNYIIKLTYHKFFQKRIFDKASGIHAITREEISSIANHTSNKNIFFVPNGIDLQHFSNTIKVFNYEVPIRLGYLGRFGKEKNISNLILAVSRLPLKYRKSLSCFLIGPEDKESDKLQELIDQNKLNDVIKFTGPLYGTDKYNFLKGLDLYVHPAYSDVVSIAVMEAMASGLPSLITRTSQVSYYYNSGSFVMTEPLVEEIKKGIIELIENRPKWKEMSQNAQKLTNDLFNWNAVVGKMITEFQNILDEKK